MDFGIEVTFVFFIVSATACIVAVLCGSYCRRRGSLDGIPNTAVTPAATPSAATPAAATIAACHDATLFERDVEAAVSDSTCPVCLEGFEERDARGRLHCSHIFHRYCIDAWMLKGGNTCPLCRAAFWPQQPPS